MLHRFVLASTQLTHTDPKAAIGAEAVARVAAWAVEHDPAEQPDVEPIMAGLAGLPLLRWRFGLLFRTRHCRSLACIRVTLGVRIALASAPRPLRGEKKIGKIASRPLTSRTINTILSVVTTHTNRSSGRIRSRLCLGSATSRFRRRPTSCNIVRERSSGPVRDCPFLLCSELGSGHGSLVHGGHPLRFQRSYR